MAVSSVKWKPVTDWVPKLRCDAPGYAGVVVAIITPGAVHAWRRPDVSQGHHLQNLKGANEDLRHNWKAQRGQAKESGGGLQPGFSAKIPDPELTLFFFFFF